MFIVSGPSVTIDSPPSPDFSGIQYGYSDGDGVFFGGTRFTAPAFRPNPPFTDGWLLYARGGLNPENPALSGNPYSLGAGAIGSGCPNGWSVSQQGPGHFWQTPCAAPDFRDLPVPPWVYLTVPLASCSLDL